MSDNRTADLYAFIDKTDSEIGEGWQNDRECLVNVLDNYASQQTASLREELQRVYELVKKWHNQSDANEQCWKETVKDYNAQREVNKSLREENERLNTTLSAEVYKNEQLARAVEHSDQRWAKDFLAVQQENEKLKSIVLAPAELRKKVSQLQEEVERLMGEIGIANAEARTQRARAIGLLEDVDRLTEIIKEAIPQNPHSHTYKILMQYKALSSKESKPS